MVRLFLSELRNDPAGFAKMSAFANDGAFGSSFFASPDPNAELPFEFPKFNFGKFEKSTQKKKTTDGIRRTMYTCMSLKKNTKFWFYQ